MQSNRDSTWLEDETGEPIAFSGSFSIGRSPDNMLVLTSEGVSRSHALIHCREAGNYFLVDLGSRNGTWLNDRRILEPVLLRDQDQIAIGSHRFVFHQTGTGQVPAPNRSTVKVRQGRVKPFWLLVADIEGFTSLSCQLSGAALADLVADWLTGCRAVVESAGGRINKYLGDGFFAVWNFTDDSHCRVKTALEELLHVRRTPPFRLALHRGDVYVGGAPILSEESFVGREVNFVFRMEKLAANLGVRLLLSEAARCISPESETQEITATEIKGFDATHRFFVPRNWARNDVDSPASDVR
jgi:adenylate cyclase